MSPKCVQPELSNIRAILLSTGGTCLALHSVTATATAFSFTNSPSPIKSTNTQNEGSVTTREGAEIHQNDSIGTLKHINCWDDEERQRRASSGSHWLCNLLLLQLLMVLLIIIPLYDTFYNFTPLSSILEAIYTDTSDTADNAL